MMASLPMDIMLKIFDLLDVDSCDNMIDAFSEPLPNWDFPFNVDVMIRKQYRRLREANEFLGKVMTEINARKRMMCHQ